MVFAIIVSLMLLTSILLGGVLGGILLLIEPTYREGV